MSHVASIELEIKDLSALHRAAQTLGLEFRTGQKTYRWYGVSVGDFPLPEGFAAGELGQCEHALSVKDNPGAYEIGVVKRRDGKPGYTLLWDFFSGGYGLQDKVGINASKLKQRYQVEVFRREMAKKGMHVTERIDANGKLRVEAVKA